MLVTVNYFKPSGRWYTTEEVEIPYGAHAWHFGDYLPTDRLLGLVAATEGETPWGYPAMYTLDLSKADESKVDPFMIDRHGDL